MSRAVLPLLAILAIFFTGELFAQTPDGFDIVRGDANNNAAVATDDATTINNYLFSGGPAPPCMDAADANDDGAVDISDSIYLMTFLQQGGPAPPAPYPSCGNDPTSDSLTCVNSQCSG